MSGSRALGCLASEGSPFLFHCFGCGLRDRTDDRLLDRRPYMTITGGRIWPKNYHLAIKATAIDLTPRGVIVAFIIQRVATVTFKRPEVFAPEAPNRIR
jgi:hypothetical protein